MLLLLLSLVAQWFSKKDGIAAEGEITLLLQDNFAMGTLFCCKKDVVAIIWEASCFDSVQSVQAQVWEALDIGR